MFAAGIASVVAAGAYAYTYNLKRFHFNADQRQAWASRGKELVAVN